MSHRQRYSLSIAVPVYNEEKTVKAILEKLIRLPIKNYEIIVVDDASYDKSSEIINSFFLKNKAIPHSVINHSKNMGKGGGIQSALKVAKGDYFVIQDADLEYNPVDIVALIKFAQRNDSIAVYGSRFKGKYENMAKANYYANKSYNFILRRMYDTSITDMHTCYKMVKADVMRDLNLQAGGFGYASELVSKLLRRKVVIDELPISFKGRSKKDGKKIGYKDGFQCVKDLIIYRFKSNI